MYARIKFWFRIEEFEFEDMGTKREDHANGFLMRRPLREAVLNGVLKVQSLAINGRECYKMLENVM